MPKKTKAELKLIKSGEVPPNYFDEKYTGGGSGRSQTEFQRHEQSRILKKWRSRPEYSDPVSGIEPGTQEYDMKQVKAIEEHKAKSLRPISQINLKSDTVTAAENKKKIATSEKVFGPRGKPVSKTKTGLFKQKSNVRTTASIKPPSSRFTPNKSKYIEIKGPFQIQGGKAAERIKVEINRLAKEYPKAEFILREVKRAKGSGSVYSAAFKGLVESNQARRVKEVKIDYNPPRTKQIESLSKVREAKIKALGAFKQVEFTFSGRVATPEWQGWRDVDISLSKEMIWDPLKSKGQHFQSIKGYQKEMVKKYVGGTSSATKKLDALIDKISEYGRKPGAKRFSVDEGIQYIKDKSAQFEEEQFLDRTKKDQTPINMLTDERNARLERLQKNYGTPPKITGKVSLISTAEKIIKPQVPVSGTVPTFEKKTVTQKSAPRITTTASAPSPVITPLKKRSINAASLKLSNKLKEQLETNQATVTKRTKGVTRTEHVLKIKTSIVRPKGQGYTTKFDKTLEPVKSVSEGEPNPFPDGLEPEKKGQVKTGLRVDITDDTPVGITLREDTARDFDVTSVHSQKGGEERGLWPEPSSERIYFDKKQGMPESNPNISYSEYPPKKVKEVPLKGTIITAPAQQSIEQKIYNPKTTQFPETARKVTPIVHPFSKVMSGMIALDKLQAPEFGEKEIFPSAQEEFRKSQVNVELGEDVGGGGHVEVSTEKYLEKQAKGLRDEVAVQKYWDKNKKWPKGALPRTALANRPWLKHNVDDTTTISDVLYGDSADYVEEGPKKGTRRASTTVTHVKEPLTPRYYGDPTNQGRRKPLTEEQQGRANELKIAEAKGDTTKVVVGKDKYGRPTETLITKYSKDTPIQDQLDKEGVYRKRRGGLSKQDIAKQQYAVKSSKERKTGDFKFESERPGTGEPGKEHGPMKTWTSKKAKSTALTASQRIRGAFKPVSKAILPPLLGIGGLALAPYFAKLQLQAKGIKDPTASQYAKETTSVFVSAPRVFGGVGEKQGYLQNLADYDIKKLRESGKRRVISKSGIIKKGDVTPYSQIKAWMFNGKREKPKSDWIGY